MKGNSNLKDKNCYYLGIDLGSHSIKSQVINQKTESIFIEEINYTDPKLIEFAKADQGTDQDKEFTVPTALFVEALWLLLDRISEKWDQMIKEREMERESKIMGIGSSAQQHGSIYWKYLIDRENNRMKSKSTNLFSIERSPTWQDSSTIDQCFQLEKLISPLELKTLTGSRAYPRFTAHQIKKRVDQSFDLIFKETEKIGLLSSLIPSILCGNYIGIDYSDGSGMNLMNMKTKKWDPQIIDWMSNGNSEKMKKLLSDPIDSRLIVGNINQQIYVKYRNLLSSNCSILSGGGDNLNSVVGSRLQLGDIGISLGTSDTVFCLSNDNETGNSINGHIFVSTLNPNQYIKLCCFSNGSNVREYLRDKYANGNWKELDKLMKETDPFNNGIMAIFSLSPEITPQKPNPFIQFFGPDNNPINPESLSPGAIVRAVLEWQILSRRLHSQLMGINGNRLILTGGGSQSSSIRELTEQIFGCQVSDFGSFPHSSCFGAALRVLYSLSDDDDDDDDDDDVNNNDDDDNNNNNNNDDDNNNNNNIDNNNIFDGYTKMLDRLKYLETLWK